MEKGLEAKDAAGQWYLGMAMNCVGMLGRRLRVLHLDNRRITRDSLSYVSSEQTDEGNMSSRSFACLT
jgi:hypothetical protein